MIPTAEARSAIASQHRRAVDEHTAAKRDLAAARRRLQAAAEARRLLEEEAQRLGLELVITPAIATKEA